MIRCAAGHTAYLHPHQSGSVHVAAVVVPHCCLSYIDKRWLTNLDEGLYSSRGLGSIKMAFMGIQVSRSR